MLLDARQEALLMLRFGHVQIGLPDHTGPFRVRYLEASLSLEFGYGPPPAGAP